MQIFFLLIMQVKQNKKTPQVHYLGNLSYYSQILMHICPTFHSESDLLLQAAFAKHMYSKILCQAQALLKCHANISVPLVM